MLVDGLVIFAPIHDLLRKEVVGLTRRIDISILKRIIFRE